jgi:hypothetical protein
MLDWLDTPPVTVPAKAPPAGTDCTQESAGTPSPLPELFNALAAILAPSEVEELRTLARTEPGNVAETCRLILAAPAFPSEEDAAELDRLLVRLCDLEPWLAGYLPAMQQARQNMAPAQYPGELARFRQWVREAEAKQAGALLRGGGGNPFAP